MKISLRKALQRKSQLISEINKHKSLVKQYNVQKVGFEEKHLNVNDELQLLREKTDELILLKTSITQKNVGIYEKLTRIEEIKSLISFYESLPVRDNDEREYDRKTESYVFTTYKSCINRGDVTGMVDILKRQLGELLDAVDEFNTVNTIYVVDPSVKERKKKKEKDSQE